MKVKIPIYLLLRALGITDKKIKYTIYKKEDLTKLNLKANIKTITSILNISELFLEKKSNLVRILAV